MIDYKAVSEKRWKDMLNALEGTEVVKFPTIEQMKSCRAVAYDINSNRAGRYYSIVMDKECLTLTITVSNNHTPLK